LLHFGDLFIWVLLKRCWPDWKTVLMIFQPETVIGWQRTSLRIFWRWKSRHRIGDREMRFDITYIATQKAGCSWPRLCDLFVQKWPSAEDVDFENQGEPGEFRCGTKSALRLTPETGGLQAKKKHQKSMTEIKETKGDRAIRRLLRRRNSQEYFSGNGWTKNPDEAKSFADSLEAAQTCVQWGLWDMEMVLRVVGSNSDLFCTELWSAPRRASFNQTVG